jgi:hypothetical protein
VVSAITSNKWSGEFLVVSGTLTNASAVAVAIKAIDSQGFDANQKIVAGGSDFTSFRKDLSPGEVVKFQDLAKGHGKTGKVRKGGAIVVTVNNCPYGTHAVYPRLPFCDWSHLGLVFPRKTRLGWLGCVRQGSRHS